MCGGHASCVNGSFSTWLTVARCCMHLDERSASTLRLVQRATDRSEPNDSDLLNVDSTSWHTARPPCVSVMQSKS